MSESLSKRDRVRKYGEVFTPPEVVSHMCDLLEEESPGAFAIEKTFLEPTCGDGAFILEILRRKFTRCRTHDDYCAALESVYGFEVQADNVAACIENVTALCREYFRPTKEDLQTISDHVILCDGLKVMRMMARMNEREPRVMKVGEVRNWVNSDRVTREPVFIEMRSGVCAWIIDDEVGEIPGAENLTSDLYSKTWRCWTSRPTDEQREATPWE